MQFVGQECAPQNVFNFFQSANTLVAGNQDTACLACLFNGMSPEAGTIWFVNGQLLSTDDMFAQVNSNGTLIIRRPPGFNGEIVFSCERNGVQFVITIICE